MLTLNAGLGSGSSDSSFSHNGAAGGTFISMVVLGATYNQTGGNGGFLYIGGDWYVHSGTSGTGWYKY